MNPALIAIFFITIIALMVTAFIKAPISMLGVIAVLAIGSAFSKEKQ